MSRPRDNEVGYGRPPVSTHFQKGQSGNPRGRPKGSKSRIPYDSVLGQKVTIRENGNERNLTAAEAFLLSLAKKGLEGDTLAARQTLAIIEQARSNGLTVNDADELQIVFRIVSPGSVSSELEHLRMAKTLDRYRPSARVVLETWIVEAALKRLGDRRLGPEEQRIVVNATRTPKKVRWPEWWTELQG